MAAMGMINFYASLEIMPGFPDTLNEFLTPCFVEGKDFSEYVL